MLSDENKKRLRYAETAIGIGVLCFTTLNYAINPVPFLVASGTVVVGRFAVKKFREKYDPEIKDQKSKYELIYKIIDKTFDFTLFIFSTHTFAFPVTHVSSLFAASFFAESIAPAIVTNISDQANEYFVPKENNDKEDKSEFIVTDIGKKFIWSSLKFFAIPILARELPAIPKAADFIILRSISKFMSGIIDNLDIPDIFKMSTCLSEAVVSYLSIESGIKAQAFAMEKQLRLNKDIVYFCVSLITSLTLEQLSERMLGKPKKKEEQPPAPQH